ncbi:DUF1654 domain-containing protein [Salinicola aestuarinus]|uniref:DUF1654 domain-containing protein n=1 Tax=Salinicola aestuarinus TaxID=1949082 RepID=UPI0013004286
MILSFPSPYQRLSHRVDAQILQASHEHRRQLVIARTRLESADDWTAMLKQLERQKNIRVIPINTRHALLSWRHHADRTAC